MTKIRTEDQEVHEVHLEVDSRDRVTHNRESSCLLTKTKVDITSEGDNI